jgi:hypothetical protein
MERPHPPADPLLAGTAKLLVTGKGLAGCPRRQPRTRFPPRPSAAASSLRRDRRDGAPFTGR